MVKDFVSLMSKDSWKALRKNNMRDFEGRNFINGEWKATPEMYSKINPSTGKAQGAFPQSGAVVVNQALLSARRAFKKMEKSKQICSFRLHE